MIHTIIIDTRVNVISLDDGIDIRVNGYIYAIIKGKVWNFEFQKLWYTEGLVTG